LIEDEGDTLVEKQENVDCEEAAETNGDVNLFC
jgi:hypothetical protein